MLEMLAMLIEKLAVYGAGVFSFGILYAPEVPEELK